MSTLSQLTIVDLSFSIMASQPMSVDHGYPLFGAISRVLPSLHEPNGLAVHPIRGRTIGDRRMQLTEASRLVVRVPTDRIAELLPLAGKQLNVAGATLRVGVPQILGLIAAPSLRSRLVTIKISGDSIPAPPTAETFLAAARKQLAALDISPQAELSLGKRRTLRIRDKEVVGYEVLVEALTAQESLALQTHGLGGRRHMGCGVFVPFGIRAGGSDG